MPNMDNAVANITITKQTGTNIHLPTQDTYVDSDIDINLDVQQATSSIWSANINMNLSSDTATKSGTNVIDSVLNVNFNEPNSGYYIQMNANSSGQSAITSSGWIDEGVLPAATISQTRYISLREATMNISGTNTVTPTVVTAGTNATLSDQNNGIYVTATGGGTASVSATATTDQPGYAPASIDLGTATINSSNTLTAETKYISGVNIPQTNGRSNSFTVTVPNGNTTQDVTFTVDSSGNVTVT